MVPSLRPVVLAAACLALAATCVTGRGIGSYIPKVCSVLDEHLGQCITDTANVLIPSLINKGDPALGIQPLTQIHVETIENLQTHLGATFVERNLTYEGFDGFHVTSVDSDPIGFALVFTIRPTKPIHKWGKIEGQTAFGLHGLHDFDVVYHLDEVKVFAYSRAITHKQNAEPHYEIVISKIVLTPRAMEYRVDGRRLDTTVGWRIIYDYTREASERQFAAVFKTVADLIISRVPGAHLFTI